MARVFTLTDVAGSEVDQVVADFKSEGATVTQTIQPNGLWTVTAVFPDTAPTATLAKLAAGAGAPGASATKARKAGRRRTKRT